jgi:hypothetical protein
MKDAIQIGRYSYAALHTNLHMRLRRDRPALRYNTVVFVVGTFLPSMHRSKWTSTLNGLEVDWDGEE